MAFQLSGQNLLHSRRLCWSSPLPSSFVSYCNFSWVIFPLPPLSITSWHLVPALLNYYRFSMKSVMPLPEAGIPHSFPLRIMSSFLWFSPNKLCIYFCSQARRLLLFLLPNVWVCCSFSEILGHRTSLLLIFYLILYFSTLSELGT